MMTLDEAVQRLEEIATGDKEREALAELVRQCEVYRSLYEKIEKRLALYRGLAAKPDIYANTAADFSDEKRGEISNSVPIDTKAQPMV